MAQNKYLPPKSTDDWFGDYANIYKRIGKISNFDQECGVLLTLTEGCFLIGEHMLSLGKQHRDQTDIKILMNRIVADKATRFIFAHNHPNGVGIFSKGDMQFTIALIWISELMEIDFMDHIVFPHGLEPISLKKRHPKIFQRDWVSIFSDTIKKYIPRGKI